MTIFFYIFIIKKFSFDLDLKAFIARSKDTESLLLTYNLLTTELKKALYKRLFFWGERSQQPSAATPILKNSLFADAKFWLFWFRFCTCRDKTNLFSWGFTSKLNEFSKDRVYLTHKFELFFTIFFRLYNWNWIKRDNIQKLVKVSFTELKKYVDFLRNKIETYFTVNPAVVFLVWKTLCSFLREKLHRCWI